MMISQSRFIMMVLIIAFAMVGSVSASTDILAVYHSGMEISQQASITIGDPQLDYKNASSEPVNGYYFSDVFGVPSGYYVTVSYSKPWWKYAGAP
jgi:hypothetical protein